MRAHKIIFSNFATFVTFEICDFFLKTIIGAKLAIGLLQLCKNLDKIISSHLPRDIRQTLLTEFDALSAYRFHKKQLTDNSRSVYTPKL